jgi:beta-lactamase superfamily II metal-dependent hydrolase
MRPVGVSTSIARPLALIAFLLVTVGTARAQTRNLDIYWIDVEGGAATLMVSPSGESLLFDAGWEVGDRDAKRIFAVAQEAGLRKIDYFILSHFHADHAGGLQALAKPGQRPAGRVGWPSGVSVASVSALAENAETRDVGFPSVVSKEAVCRSRCRAAGSAISRW